MLRLWWPAFAAADYAERDFAAALPRLVTAEATPNWPREHLAAINRELRAERDRRARASLGGAPGGGAGPAPSGPRCPLCDWTGWVLVPHPTCFGGGQWLPPYRTCGVACTRCGPGQRAYAALSMSGRNPLTLDAYERRHCPAWAEFLAERAEAERLMQLAEGAADVCSPGFPRLAQQIARRAAG